jgi:ABC-type thiamine transport system substrate-binding protein
VYPVRLGTPLPEVFTKHSVVPSTVLELPADEVDAHRADWVDTWTDLVVR